jgi:hypothetical protein
MTLRFETTALALAMALLLPAAARGVVFKCVAAQGKVLITDRPCPPGCGTVAEVDLPPPPPSPPLGEILERAALERARARALAAQAEAARLRAALYAEQLEDRARSARMRVLKRRLDALAEEWESR